MRSEMNRDGTVGTTRRSAGRIMLQLIGLIKPLLHIMLLAIILGTAGYLCAIFLTILAGQTILRGLAAGVPGMTLPVNFAEVSGSFFLGSVSVKGIFILMAVIAVLRGLLHYVEQYCKLEGRDKGNLISIITTDIELLEVFYAHTISPIAIAVLTSLVMIFFIGRYHPAAGVFALVAYLVMGVVIPLWNGKRGGESGMQFRTEFGELNSFVLDSLRGLDETIQYQQGVKRADEMQTRSDGLAGMQKKLSRMEGSQRSVTNLVILLASFGMLFLTLHMYGQGSIGYDGVLTCTIAMMGSFGPVVALSSLSNNLNQTLASGERVLSILEEKPQVEEVMGEWKNKQKTFSGADAQHVTFAYEDEMILDDYSLDIPAGKILGIHGTSGSGKSTLLKLLMRFWDVNSGTLHVDGEDVRKIPTKYLRDMESYVTQETHLFHDSIANNIAIGKPGATREEIMEAARKASIHDFIMCLPKGYDTEVGELGDTLSGGEKQRIGIARAFIHDSPFLLMDEPTSNLDSLNEGIILKSLRESAEEKTVVLVSHRKSTMNVADVVFEMKEGRIS